MYQQDRRLRTSNQASDGFRPIPQGAGSRHREGLRDWSLRTAPFVPCAVFPKQSENALGARNQVQFWGAGPKMGSRSCHRKTPTYLASVQALIDTANAVRAPYGLSRLRVVTGHYALSSGETALQMLPPYFIMFLSSATILLYGDQKFVLTTQVPWNRTSYYQQKLGLGDGQP